MIPGTSVYVASAHGVESAMNTHTADRWKSCHDDSECVGVSGLGFLPEL